MKKLTLTIIFLAVIISPILPQEHLKMEVSLPNEEEILEKCPGSIRAMNLINFKVINMATKEERLEFLKIQQNRSKNTLMQKKINNSIQAESK